MEHQTIIEALSRHKEGLTRNGEACELAEAKILFQTADTLSLQAFCTENPEVGSDERIWAALFQNQYPGLYTPFLEVALAYKSTSTTKLPLSVRTERIGRGLL